MGDIGNSIDKRSQDHTLIGDRANLIKYKKDLQYKDFSDDPFGKVKLAKKEEQRLQSQIAREMKSKAAGADGGEGDGQPVIQSALLAEDLP